MDKFEVKGQDLLLDWIVENYRKFGTSLRIITDKSQQGSQFCNGFGGFGGRFIRNKYDIQFFFINYSIFRSTQIQDRFELFKRIGI